MAVFTKVNDKEIQSILDDYGLKLLGRLPSEFGKSNTNIVIDTDQGKYVLTLVEDRPMEVVERTAKALLWLREHHISSTPVIHTSQGNLVSSFREKSVLIKHFVEGDILQKLDDKGAFSIGNYLAHLHTVAVPPWLKNKHFYREKVFEELSQKGIDNPFENWLRTRLEALSDDLPNGLPEGLVHGDMFLDNILFANGDVKAILDFEEICRDVFILDLGMAIVGCCFPEGKLDEDLASSLVRGYSSRRHLSEKERDGLFAYVHFGIIKTSSWRYWKYRVILDDDTGSGLYWEMARQSDHLNTIGKDQFYNMVFTKIR